jgi:hypothetical protein
MRSLRKTTHALLAATFIATVIASTPGAASASATPAPSVHAPSMLVLTIAKGERPEPVDRAAALSCTPRGGDHPAIADACASIEAANGDIASIAQGPGPCDYVYRPLTVTARGVWGGTLTEFQATYPNRCVMLRSTGAVFGF